MILAALLLAAAPAQALDGPTPAEVAATCRAVVKARTPEAELARIVRAGALSKPERAQLARECLIYLEGARDSARVLRPRP